MLRAARKIKFDSQQMRKSRRSSNSCAKRERRLRKDSPLLRAMQNLLCLDFPIGVPAVYASRAAIERFPEALREFGSGEWSAFYEVAETVEEGRRVPFL